MQKLLLLSILTFFFLRVTYAQIINISGYVHDVTNNEKIIDVNVIELNSKTIAISNNYGFFNMPLKKSKKPYILKISHIAYQIDTLFIKTSNDTIVNIYLKPGKTLDEVKITESHSVPIEKRTEISVLSIPMKQINMLPALGGERDIIKAYQLMPGVQSGMEGSSGLLVRGGSMDQNLILIDGTPIYYINHLGGFVSVFNNEAINSTKLYKGGFPARYGGRLSSVLDIRMKEGNNKKFGGSASIGLISAKVMLEGPIKKNKTSFLVSYRRMLYDLLMRPISKAVSNGYSTGYYFQDLNLKINHIFSEKDRIYLSMYYGDDKLTLNYDNKVDSKIKFKNTWGNLLTVLRWNHLYGKKIFGNISASFTRYRFNNRMKSELSIDNNIQKNYNSFFSGIYDYSINSDFEYYLFSNYTMRFGALATYHVFKPGITRFGLNLNNSTIINKVVSDENIYAFESAAYLENDFKTGNFLFNIGFRYTNYSITNNFYQFFEPRFLAKYVFLGNHSIEFSFARMHQNVHLLSNSGVGIPVDFWLPATGSAPPSVSNQFTIGYAGTILKSFEVSVEGFYKKLENLITFKEGESYFGTNKTWLDKIETSGVGTVYGIDFLMKKSTGRLTGWIGYTWMKNYRQFAGINNGKKYPYKYDRTNDISIVINYQLSEKIDLSLTWVYGTGQALTLPVAKYYLPIYFPGSNDLEDAYLDEIYIYTRKNAFRAKPYHRMDIGINFHKQKKWGERIWNISIYNLYNRKNPYFYYFSGEGNGNTGKVELYQQSLFPIIPSVSYTIKF